MVHLSGIKFFGTNHYYYFHLTIGPFHCAKFKKILTADSELWGCAIFGLKMVQLPQTKIFWENYWYHSHLPISPFHCAKLKKNSSCGSRVLRMHHFLGPKWPISPNEHFFRKPINEPCFFHSCLSTCQKSKSDINLLMKYWQLKNTEIWLAESHFVLTWEPDFSQACSFHRMSMNHKNFRFTQIPDKTNDMIFLKSSKTLFLGHFWPFLVIFAWWRFFPKNPAVTHNYI